MAQALFDNGAAPATPAAGVVALYSKSDKTMAYKDDTGLETVITTGANAQTFTATMAANAVTIAALNSVPLTFRSTTLGSGAVSSVITPSANLVIPSGATLGTVNAVLSEIVVVEMNNGGTREYAVANLAGGLQMDEKNLISTTAISAASSAANVWYSTTARTSLPYRVIGSFQSTQATAGTWASSASLVQSAFGEALTAMSSLGYGQTTQNVTGSRVAATTYYNTTGKPIIVTVSDTLNAGWSATITANGQTFIYGGNNSYGSATFIVLPGNAYAVSAFFSGIKWLETR